MQRALAQVMRASDATELVPALPQPLPHASKRATRTRTAHEGVTGRTEKEYQHSSLSGCSWLTRTSLLKE